MTHPEVVSYLERLIPVLRRKTGNKYLDDGEAFQKTIFAIMRKADTLIIHTDDEFITLFKAYYWYQKRYEFQLEAERSKYYSDSFEGIAPTDEYNFIGRHSSYNPFDNPLVNALEYIELINDPLLKRIAFLYYIEGYTLEEVGFMYGHQKMWAQRKVQDVVRAIQIGIAIHCTD